MNKVNCTNMQDFAGSIRKYFNFKELRILLVEHYDDCEDWHKHETTSQIIFVIKGAIKVHSILPELANKNEFIVKKTETVKTIKNIEIVNEDEFIIIPPQEWHKVAPKTNNTKLLVIKYKSNNINIIEELKKDYIRM